MNETNAVPNKVAMPCPLRHMLAAFVAALFSLLACPAGANAQFGLSRPSQNPDDPQITAEFGFGGFLWPNRWVPVTITLTGGAKAFDGFVTISYAQDNRTTTQLFRPVAATPGKTSTFSALVNLPPSGASVNLALMHRNMREVRSIDFNSFPDTAKGEAYIPPPSGNWPIVLALGEPTDPALSTVRSLLDDKREAHAIGVAQPSLAFVRPSTLPPTWAALDGVLMVVTPSDASTNCDPRVLAAVREWVSSGGRLVILAAAPGDAWRDWFAPSLDAPVPIAVAPARTGAPPAELAEALEWEVPYTGTPDSTTTDISTPTEDVDAASPPAEHHAPATSLAFRPISLTPFGEAHGWMIRFTAPDHAATGLVAEGPFGFGWITVVGFNPQLVASTVANQATSQVWYSLLSNTLHDWRERKTAAKPTNFSHISDQFTTGGLTVSDNSSQQARNTALDNISDIPTASHSVFPALAAGMFVLALLLGPVDALLLKRLRARHRSWATAIGWIGLASVAAYFAPTMARSGNTRINRLSVVDVMQLSPDPASPAPAWKVGVTGVFAGASMTMPFKGNLSGSWWKPTSSQQEYYYQGGDNMSPRRSVAATQSMPDLTALSRTDDPWGGLGAAGDGLGGNIPTPVTFKLWTFRTFQDQGRAATPLRVAVRNQSSSDSPEWRVELHGMPAGAVITSAAVRVPHPEGERWHPLSFNAEDNHHLATTARLGTSLSAGDWAEPDPNKNPFPAYYGWQGNTARPLQNQLTFLLPGPDRREMSIAHMVKSGHAVVYLALRNMPLDATVDADTDRDGKPDIEIEERHTQICRIVVPIDGAEDHTEETAK